MNQQTRVTEELKPCPFCGEQLEHVPNEECVSQWFHPLDHPLASNCILNGQGIADLTAWNTRIEAITRSEVTEDDPMSEIFKILDEEKANPERRLDWEK